MSLILLFTLISIGLSIILILRLLEHTVLEKHMLNAGVTALAGYITVLFFTSLGLFGAGIYYWLKEEKWFSVNTQDLISVLDEKNSFRNLMLSDTNWQGVQKIHEWYLNTNLIWSLLVTIIVLITILIITSDD